MSSSNPGVHMGEIANPEPENLDEVDLYTVFSTAAAHFKNAEVPLPGFAAYFERKAKTELEKGSNVVVTLEDEQKINDRLAKWLLVKEEAAAVEPSAMEISPPLSPKEAFQVGDVEASKRAHDKNKEDKKEKDESHISLQGGDKLKSIVYGGLDGIITTFAVVSGAAGGGLGTDVILILGVSNMFADALSMGMGDALSTKAENDMIWMERKREQWEYDNNPEGEVDEMIDIYEERGLTRDNAEKMVRLMTTSPEFFVDQMVQDELGLTVPDEDDNPWYDGLITFTSFVGFGTVPLLVYLCTSFLDLDSDVLFVISCVLTAVMLFVLGVCKSICTAQTWYESGGEILLFGGLTAVVSYALGALVESIVHS